MSVQVPASPLDALAPQALWRAFASLCAIPHPSHHETAIIAFLRGRAEAAGLAAEVDAAGNLIVRKPATPGLEGRTGVVLQAHVDMVPQANADTPHDFTKDPIRPRVDGAWVKATGTTLGADNGIGGAAMLALMEATDVPHGPLEFLFTVEEETGLAGASQVKAGRLSGRILLNLDSEEIGHIIIGCAGGRDVTVRMPIASEPAPAGVVALKVTARGLTGGHSGIDIQLGRANAIRVLARALRQGGSAVAAASGTRPRLAEIAGGTARNALPREAEAVVCLPAAMVEAFRAAVAAEAADLAKTYVDTDPNLTVAVAETALPHSVLAAAPAEALLRAVNACTDGIARLSQTLPGTPETSSNLGVIRTDATGVEVVCMVRSSDNPSRDALCDRISDVFALVGGRSTLGAAYPGWLPDAKAPILELLSGIYEKQNGKPADITTLHAGLECAILGAAYPHWEMASIGPTIRGPHSPDERVDIESVKAFWNWLTATLAAV